MPTTSATPAQDALATSFTVRGIDPHQITYHYDTMPGNQPKSYGNTIFIWQTPLQGVPINTTPTASQPVANNQPDGDNVFQGLNVSTESYLLGYAVGNKVQNIVATVFVPAIGGGEPTPSAPSVQVTNVGSTSVTISYQLPIGMQPQSDGDWIGIWEGGEALLYSVPPTQFSLVNSNANRGDTGMNLDIPLGRGATYTIGYFKGGYAGANPGQQTLAASTTFTV